MKKVGKILLCVLMCFSFAGCFNKMYTRSATNNIKCSNCGTVNDLASLINNIERSMSSVSVSKVDYVLVNTKNTFHIKADIITKDKRVKWDLAGNIIFDDTNIQLYLKDGKLYAIYPHNGANVIMKDNLDNVAKEIEITLDALKANYDKEELNDFITGDKLEGFSFDSLKEKATYLKNSDGSYTIKLIDGEINWEFDVTSNYLFKEIRSSADNFNAVLKFEYPNELKIEYPMSLDFLTLDIEEVKEVLKVDNFAQLIDEDLKK